MTLRRTSERSFGIFQGLVIALYQATKGSEGSLAGLLVRGLDGTLHQSHL